MTVSPTPRIALCIPAYNAARTLPRLFDSVAAQTQPFDEVWLYDDASTDDTAAVAASRGAKVVHGSTNVGCSGGKNALLAHATTEWMHFHDADDALHPEFVARAKARIAAGTFDVLLFDYEQYDEASGTVMSRSNFAATTVLVDPLRFMVAETVNNGGVYSAELLRRVGGFDLDPAVRYNEDRAFHLRIAEAGARFAYEPYVGSRFFYTAGSMSARNQLACSRAQHEITRRFAERHPGSYPLEVASMSWKNAANLAANLDWESADSCVRLAVRAGGRIPASSGRLFQALCLVDARFAIRARERLIRILKPGLRT